MFLLFGLNSVKVDTVFGLCGDNSRTEVTANIWIDCPFIISEANEITKHPDNLSNEDGYRLSIFGFTPFPPSLPIKFPHGTRAEYQPGR
jgi:hypothetical protein